MSKDIRKSPAARAILGAALLVVAIVLFVVLQDDGSGERNGEPRTPPSGREASPAQPETARPEPPIPTIVIRDRRPVGGPARLEFDAGERVRFRVRSDNAGEIHVHGYEVSRDIEAGGTEVVGFPADIQGVFEVELHGAAEQIAELRVSP